MEPEKQLYLYDILLLSSDPAPIVGEEDSAYTYSVRLLKDFIELPYDRILVEAFPSEPLGQLVSSPCELTANLAAGVCVTLRQGDEVLGTGRGSFPSLFLRQLSEPTFLATHVMCVELVKRKKPVATLELCIKLQSSHPDIDNKLAAFGCFDVCRPVDKSVNPHDVIFTMGRSRIAPNTTCITDERLMSAAAYPFVCQHKDRPAEGGSCGCAMRGAQLPPLPPNPDRAAEQQLADVQQLMRELNLDGPKVPTPPPCHSQGRMQSQELRCQCMELATSEESDSEPDPVELEDYWSDGGQGGFEGVLGALQEREMMEARRRCMCGKPQPQAPQLMISMLKPSKVCALCHADISWLPSLAACPFCGYRDAGEVVEEPYDDRATAKQLLREYVESVKATICHSASEQDNAPLQRDDEQEQDPNVPRRCDCADGRACTRCRIRKMCEHVFTENNRTVPELDTTPAAPQELEKKPSTVSQRRSKLVKIFTEMRNAYEQKKSSTNVAAKQARQQECLEICKTTKKSKAAQSVLQELEEQYPIKAKKRARSKRRPRSKRYCYTQRNHDPSCPRIGHRSCISDSAYSGYSKIPYHMGWNWTKSEMARHKAWKPGAIAKPIRTLMSYFLKDFPLDNLCLSRYHYIRPRPSAAVEPEPLVQHPTLHISKKNDKYTITLRPLKDPKALAVCADPYANMKPIVFHISKDCKEEERRRLKAMLRELGFAPCCCERPVAECFCRSFIEKKRLKAQVTDICEKHGVPDVSGTFVYSESSESDSEAEYDFGVTPPAGLIKPERLNRPDQVHCETQYCENDCALVTVSPLSPTALVQYHACACGERKAPFQFIYGNRHMPTRQSDSPKKKNQKKKR